MLAPLPKFELKSSPLFQAFVDGSVAQVWEFWSEGEYPGSTHLKQEVERRTAEVLATWSDEDFRQLAQVDSWVQAGFDRVGLEDAADPEAHWRRRVAMRVVELGLHDAESALVDATLRNPEPAYRTFQTVPGLWQELDARDFLVQLSADRVPRDLISDDPLFYFGDYALFPHPYLRGARELFWRLTDLAVRHKELKVQVAVDPFRVLPRDEVPMRLLLDYWYGVKVTRDNLDSVDVRHLGRAVHYRTLDTVEAKRNEAFFPLIATEFLWSVRDGTIKILQIEEVRPAQEVPHPDGLVLNRYLHTERDTMARSFTHLDGSLKGYPTASYRPSRGKDPLAKRGKARVYRKLWRVDGRISDDDWGMLVGQYYRQNELIAEHLGEFVDERLAAE